MSYPPSGPGGYPTGQAYPPGGGGYPPGGGGYPPGGGGYPPQHGGYPPQHGGGYPPAPGGYPPGPGGFPPGPPNSGPPPPPGQWGGAPGYPPAPGGGGYGYPGGPPHPGGPPPHGGFGPPHGGPPHGGPPHGGPPHAGFPPDANLYGGDQGYGGYSGSSQPPIGFNSGPQGGGYPAQSAGGYPAQPPAAGGYPSQPPAGGGYPAQAPAAGGYPAQAPVGGGYPAQGGYPQSQPQSGYPQGQQGGYSAAPGSYQQGGGGGYPQQQPGGYGGGSGGGGLVKDPGLSGQMSGMSLSSTQGTVKPVANFDADADCEVLRKAMRGMGTDENAIIDLVTARSQAQRQKILLQYKTNYGKDLTHALKSELSGHFESSILALFGGAGEYDALCLHRAIEGLGTDEHLLIEILCTRTNAQIKEINEAYKRMYHKTLEQECVNDTSGQFKRVLVSMCQANRDESTTVDRTKASADAAALYKAGEKKWGTEESVFNRILAAKSYIYLRTVFDEYTKVANRDIASTIDREFSGDIRKAYKTIVYIVRNPAQYFAGRMNKAIKGAGTDEYALIRMAVSRSEIDMVQIKQEYQRAHSNSLYKDIKNDTSGDFRKVLLNIVGQ